MTSNTLVFDIETQNFFTDPGVGRDNFGALKISVVGAYSYGSGEYACFDEKELKAAAELFRAADTLVGFGINRFDIPVLTGHFARLLGAKAPDLWGRRRVDMLERIESCLGSRISLGKLAEANLGLSKTGRGSEAPELYRQGKIAELKEYCLQDVRLTKELFDLCGSQGYVAVPLKNGEVKQVSIPKSNAPSTLF